MAGSKVPEWTLDGVLDEMAQVHRSMRDRQFAFILGAGASFTSGIPTGADLARRWLRELHVRECFDGRPIEKWLADCGVGGGTLTLDTAPEYYSQIFDRRFDGDRESGYAELEAAMEGKSPSLGYSLLAEIIQHTRHKVVVTTNFDNLVADALAMHAHQSPLVVAHESLTGFVRPQLRRPLVAKIHRDLFLNPINDAAGVATLEASWKQALKKLFQYFTPVVVGYAGNDGSLMDTLLELEAGDISGRAIWCYREGSTLPDRAKRMLLKHRGVAVRIPGFDEFMLQLADRLVEDFDVAVIAERIAELGKTRADRYRKQAKNLQATSARGTPAEQRAGEVLTRSMRAESWWAWEMKARAEPDIDKRNDIYRAGIEQFPTSAELLGNYANFLADVRHDREAAREAYEKAIALDPSNVHNMGNFASFLFLQGENKTSDASHANTSSRNDEDIDRAEALFEKALTIAPENIANLDFYAAFLATQRKDFSKAESVYRKALDIAPTDNDLLANFAYFLLTWGKGDSSAEILALTWRAIDAARPKFIQALAESLYYGALTEEWAARSNECMLERLKGLMDRGFERCEWDFNALFESVLPRLPIERLELFRAIGDAILDENKMADLRHMDAWAKIEAIDPFTDA